MDVELDGSDWVQREGEERLDYLQRVCPPGSSKDRAREVWRRSNIEHEARRNAPCPTHGDESMTKITNYSTPGFTESKRHCKICLTAAQQKWAGKMRELGRIREIYGTPDREDLDPAFDIIPDDEDVWP